MRGIQIKKLLQKINSQVSKNNSSAESAKEILDALIIIKQELSSISKSLKETTTSIVTDWLDELELLNEIEWAIKILEIHIQYGKFDYLLTPINEQSVDYSNVVTEISEYISEILKQKR